MAAINEVVNEDFIISITPIGGSWTGNPENFTFTPVLSTKLKLNEKKALLNELLWVVSSGCILPGFEHSGGQTSFPIKASAKKCSADKLPLLLKGDKGECSGAFTNSSGGTPCKCSIEIVSAGQTKVKGE